MNAYALSAACAGLIVLLAAWLPEYLSDRPLSLPMVLLVIGAVTFSAVPGSIDVDPRNHLEFDRTRHRTRGAHLAARCRTRARSSSRMETLAQCVASGRDRDARHDRTDVPRRMGGRAGPRNCAALRRSDRADGPRPRCGRSCRRADTGRRRLRTRGRGPVRADERSRSERRAGLPVRVRCHCARRRCEVHRLGTPMGVVGSARRDGHRRPGRVGCRQDPFADRVRPTGPPRRTRVGHAGFRCRRSDPRDVWHHRDRAWLRLPGRLRRGG